MADEQIVDENVLTDDESEDLLRDAKYGTKVEEETPAETEPSTDTEESEDSEESDQITDDASEQSDTFTKKFDQIKGDTPEEYAKNLEIAYENSTAEFQKLRSQPAPIPKPEEPDEEESDPPAQSWTDLYAQQKLQEEADTAYAKLVKDYPQAADQQSPAYQQFVKKVDIASRVIMQTENRLASPSELYAHAASLVGWEKSHTEDEALRAKLKDDASVSRNPSATRKPTTSKVTDAEVAMYKKLNQNEKTDTEIRAELEIVK